MFNNAIDALSDDDKTLPQVESLLPILRRGIGIHHGGLLPILKEVIEILFQEVSVPLSLYHYSQCMFLTIYKKKHNTCDNFVFLGFVESSICYGDFFHRIEHVSVQL